VIAVNNVSFWLICIPFVNLATLAQSKTFPRRAARPYLGGHPQNSVPYNAGGAQEQLVCSCFFLGFSCGRAKVPKVGKKTRRIFQVAETF
jgi:hypothetical protein